MLSSLYKVLTDENAYNAIGDFLVGNVPGYSYIADALGYTQKRNTQRSTTTQIDYENYLRSGNERALSDWYKNVGIPQGRTIKYPEFSYPGQIYRANTSIARSGFDYSNASANYYGNLPYRTAGLYGIGGRISRSL